jgi:hypothetical protein
LIGRWTLGVMVALAAVTAWAALRPGEHGRTQPPAPLGPPARPALAGVALGASLNGALYDPVFAGLRGARQLDSAAAHGVRVGRADAFWASTETLVAGRRVLNWTVNDRTAAELARRGIRWWPIIDYSADWASSVPGDTHAPPVHADDFARYARAFAARYGPSGDFWSVHPELPRLPVAAYEIWNEPDSGTFWRPRPDPARYLDLYLRARTAIRAVDPSTPVVTGGVTAPGAGFVSDLLRARPAAIGHIDGIAIHPYAGTPASVLDHVREFRTVLDANGAARIPLLVTEFGWVDSPRKDPLFAPPRRKARYVTEAMTELAASGCGVKAVLLYSWTTPERDPRERDSWYGVHPADGGETPSSRAFAAVLRRASAAPPRTTTSCAHPPSPAAAGPRSGDRRRRRRGGG